MLPSGRHGVDAGRYRQIQKSSSDARKNSSGVNEYGDVVELTTN